MFKEKILQYVAEKSNNIFKSLRGKGKITENQLKYFTIVHKKVTNLGKMFYYLKFIKDILMLHPAGKYWSPGRHEDVPLQRPKDVP